MEGTHVPVMSTHVPVPSTYTPITTSNIHAPAINVPLTTLSAHALEHSIEEHDDVQNKTNLTSETLQEEADGRLVQGDKK